MRISSAEFFATRGQHAVRTSAGVRASYPATSLFDFVLIASDGAREAEFHGELSRRRVEDLLEETVEACVWRATHSTRRRRGASRPGDPERWGGRRSLQCAACLRAWPVSIPYSAQAAFQG
jgi:predicted Zn-dependent protease